MGDKTRSKREVIPMKHKIARVDLLSLSFWIAAIKRIAIVNRLYTSDVEVLGALSAICALNERRIGQSIGITSEVGLSCGKGRRATENALVRLASRGLVLNEGECSLWLWNPFAYSLTVEGKKVLKQIDEEIEEEQKRINNYKSKLKL